MKCLTVLYLHYNEAMQNMFFSFIVCKYSRFPGAVQICSLWLNVFIWTWKNSIGLIYLSIYLFFAECSTTANVQGTKSIDDTPEFTEHLQTRTKMKLLLYGHLYVVALLICAFLLMEKNKEIHARNVDV